MGSTFAEYSPNTMTTSNGEDDFPLYAYQEQLSGAPAFPTSATYAEHFYAPVTTFDSYQPQQAFAFPQQDLNYAGHPKGVFFSQSPSFSPANSVSHSFDPQVPVLSSTSDSIASGGHSTISSAIASPSLSAQNAAEWSRRQPSIVSHDGYHMYTGDAFDAESISAAEKLPGCVDPSLIEPSFPAPYTSAAFAEVPAVHSPRTAYGSPVPPQSATATPQLPSAPGPIRSNSRTTQAWQPYPAYEQQREQERRRSVSSSRSQSSFDSSDENRGICPIASCGRHIKDLKAHMLTHQNERPEKCPIPSCEYHVKGFARKYDKNRHTLTHYKGTMVCGFCPGSGSSSEKSFNRADVFKRHLTSVHGVEQTAPNSRRKSPAATASSASARRSLQQRDTAGTCSTCGVTFANAQALYEHLDDCVLRVVQQSDPSEAINEKLLTSMADDKEVQASLMRHNLPTAIDVNAPTSFDQAEDEVDSQ